MNQKLNRCQCGRDPLLKWQAGGFGRVPSWRIDCVCGATISEIVARQTYYCVVCEECGAMTSPTAKTPAEAIVKWNRRTGWDDYSGNPDYDPRREDHRGGLQPESIIRNVRGCAEGNCDKCSLSVIFGRNSNTPKPLCQYRMMLAAADTIEHLMERERRRKQT